MTEVRLPPSKGKNIRKLVTFVLSYARVFDMIAKKNHSSVKAELSNCDQRRLIFVFAHKALWDSLQCIVGLLPC